MKFKLHLAPWTMFSWVALCLLGAGGVTGCKGDMSPGMGNALPTSPVSYTAFSEALPIPPLLSPEVQSDGTKKFTLKVQKGSQRFVNEGRTSTYGYNGDFLGPTLRASQGDQVSFSIQNQLSESTTVHWHGGHVPAAMDGGPHQVIAAGETWEPNFTIDQTASTIWYHPHLLGKTGAQVYKGLAGLFLIDDDVSTALDLPQTYGVDDIPVILQDRRFKADGSFAYLTEAVENMGALGDVFLVNGVIQPRLALHYKRVRLRLLNGSNARIYRLSFSDGREFHQIASDGGLLAAPVALTSLRLAPGERAEIVLQFSQNEVGSQLYLMNGNTQLLRLSVKEIKVLAGSLPDNLTSITTLSAADAAQSRSFTLGMDHGMSGGGQGWDHPGFGKSQAMSMGGGGMTGGMGTMGGMAGMFYINGKSFRKSRVDETVTLGDTEVWTFKTNMMVAHPMHIHGLFFQVLSRDGSAPPLNEQGWKDTLLVNPNETVKVIALFQDYTGIYMYHCHILEHEDQGMMGQYEVVSP